jgi:hypothetical protein
MDIKGNFSGFTGLSSIGLARGNVARIEDARGTTLRVETGSVWVTQDGSRDDVLLDAGESFRIERDGTTVLSPLGKRFALVSLEPSIPVVPGRAERFWRFWAGLYAMPMRPIMEGL